MASCRICGAEFQPFLSLGRMPIANGFLEAKDFATEYFYELGVGFCSSCSMVQLAEQPDRELMFHDHYPFFSSSSRRMAEHFSKLAEQLYRERIGGRDAFVVEIGSNDGVMLRNFAARGVRHLGVEPSTNVARVARDRGVNTRCSFFEEDVAAEIADADGQADVVLGCNVMCHLPYLHSVLGGLRTLLKESGLAVFEDPYLGAIVEKTAYDQIYDEHVFYFSIGSLDSLLSRHGLELVDAELIPVHGGSIRYSIAHAGQLAPSARLVELRGRETGMGLMELGTFERFRGRVETSRSRLMGTLDSLAPEKIVGYGATSKSTTVINYCGITPEHLSFISDTTPEKQGKYSPGAHIPVAPYERFSANYPKYALLLAWNHREEIMEKEKRYRQLGGRWIEYVPDIRIS